MTNDADVRGGRGGWARLGQHPQVMAIPRLSEDGREGVAVPPRSLQDGRKFLLDHQQALILDAGVFNNSLVVDDGPLLPDRFGFLDRIADCPDEPLTGTQASDDAARLPIFVDCADQSARCGHRGAFASLGRLTDLDHV